MAATTSPTSGRRYGIAQVCQIWDVPRSSFYADRRRAGTTTTPVPAQRRGPKPRVSDGALLAAIRADLARSPWHGEGHRKVWARLRVMDGVRVARKRVLRLMRENALAVSVPIAPARRHAARSADHHRGAESDVGHRRQCAAASGVRDGGRPPAIGLQEQVANHRKRRGSKARVVSVTEKAPKEASGGRQEGEHP